MNGYADFVFTQHGWRCTFSAQLRFNKARRKVVCSSVCKKILINGDFNQLPKPGQFCKRPHKLLDWSK